MNDAFGNPLKQGDEVILIQIRRRELIKGVVLRLGASKVIVEAVDPYSRGRTYIRPVDPTMVALYKSREA